MRMKVYVVTEDADNKIKSVHASKESAEDMIRRYAKEKRVVYRLEEFNLME
jgi:predicted CopG family antitoxin